MRVVILSHDGHYWSLLVTMTLLCHTHHVLGCSVLVPVPALYSSFPASMALLVTCRCGSQDRTTGLSTILAAQLHL